MQPLAMPRPIPTLADALVTLRPPRPDTDAADYLDMNADPVMHVWTGNEVLGSLAEARQELENYLAMDDVSTWMIVDNASSRVIGRFFLTLALVDGSRVVGEGNRVARPFWRRGHNRAARTLMFRYSFTELDADQIETEVWAGNSNSVASIEAHGFVLHSEEMRWNPKHQRELAFRTYRMTRPSWRRTNALPP